MTLYDIISLGDARTAMPAAVMAHLISKLVVAFACAATAGCADNMRGMLAL